MQTGDFRLNPVVKLSGGALVSGIDQRSPYLTVADKADECKFGEEDVSLNIPNAIQARARTVMFALKGALLFLFAFAARRAFGDTRLWPATTFQAT